RFRPAFELYGPKLRLQRFPKADWRFLARAAGNTARVFNVVHSAGHVIGDVNHGNLVIGQDATVRLIDCDSFQITAAGKTWFCEVGVGTHQPPEMQGRSSQESQGQRTTTLLAWPSSSSSYFASVATRIPADSLQQVIRRPSRKPSRASALHTAVTAG